MWDVVFYEVFKEEMAAIKKILPSRIRAKFFSETIQEAKNPSFAPLISVRTQSIIPPHFSVDLKGILTRSSGYDHLVAQRNQFEKKISYGYLPHYCSRACAEQAMLLATALLRKLPLQVKNFDRFNRDNITGHECQGKKLLVAGVGRIGSEVVDIARGLRMDVRGMDLVKRLKDLQYVSLSEGVSWADIEICSLPLTDRTRGLLNYKLFRQAQNQKKSGRGVIFVNISRGEISPARDLNRLLEEGIFAGVGLDVFEDEAFLAESLRKGQKFKSSIGQWIQTLRKRDNVILTPHNAFNTYESTERKAQQSVKAVIEFLEKEKFPDSLSR